MNRTARLKLPGAKRSGNFALNQFGQYLFGASDTNQFFEYDISNRKLTIDGKDVPPTVEFVQTLRTATL